MPIAAKLVALLRHSPAAPAMAGRPVEHHAGTPTQPRRPTSAIEPATDPVAANPGNPGAGAVVSCETGLACLFRLGIQNGVYADVGAVGRRNLVDGETLPVAQLGALAGEFGLSAERARLDWRALQTRPFAHPLVLILGNANAVILMGLRRGGAEEVAISDPLFRDGETFFVPRAEFERSWHGEALVITPVPPSRDDAKFGFSWFTQKLFAERRLIRDVVVAALAMHLIALSVPIFFRSWSTRWCRTKLSRRFIRSLPAYSC